MPARDLSRARGYFYAGIAIAGIIGNPLSGSLLELDGIFNLHGTQWMFLIEGVIAIIVGIWSFFFLDDKPSEAKWLPADQREALSSTISEEDTAKFEGHGPKKALLALGNWRIWYFSLIYFCIQIAVYGFTFFLPTQVTGITGQKLGFLAALVTAIPWVFSLIAVAIFPKLADRTRRHRLIFTVLLVATAVGLVASGALSAHPALAIGGLSLAAIGFVAAQPVFWTLPTEYMTGYAAAAGIALINAIGNLGGFVAPIMRNAFTASLGQNAGTYSLAAGAILAAILFALTGVFRKANIVESGEVETLRRVED